MIEIIKAATFLMMILGVFYTVGGMINVDRDRARFGFILQFAAFLMASAIYFNLLYGLFAAVFMLLFVATKED